MLLATLLTAALAQEPSPADLSAHTAFLWQGFEHRWRRRAFGSFAVPHRVSRFANLITDEQHLLAPGGLRSTASVAFAQSTGVDGDWMVPAAFLSRLHAPDVQVRREQRTFAFADQVQDPDAPRAFRRFHEVLRVPAPDVDTAAVVLLGGMAIRSKCLDGDDLCNSDGLWPYRFGIELSPCARVDDELVCPLQVEIGRAWTPNRGGVKLIEEKPVSERMSIEIDVPLILLSGTSEALAATPIVFERAMASNREQIAGAQQIPVPVPGGDRYPHATVGLTALGFEFYPAGTRNDLENRGRYVGGWDLHVRPAAYDPTAGLFTLSHAGSIFLPRTVRRTGVGIELGMAIVQLGHPDARLDELPPTTTTLCSDGDEAPFFSRWIRCDKVAGGIERIEDIVPVAFEP
jgi:hypothetical protein